MPKSWIGSRPFAGLTLIALILCLANILPNLAIAAPRNNSDLTGRWGFGIETGIMKLIEGEWDYSTVDQFGGLHVTRGLSDQWNLAFALQYGYVRPGAEFRGEEVGFSGSSGAPLYTTIIQPMVKLQHRFSPTAMISPVLGVGLGVTDWQVSNQTGQDVGWFPSGTATSGFDTDGAATVLQGTDFTILLELGLDVALSQSLFLNLGARYEVMPGNKKDNIGMSSYWLAEHVDANTGLAQAYLGLTLWWGSGDRDHDGIANDDDQCPDSAEDFDGYNDTDGCPEPDNDGDGLLDADDACPSLAEDLDGFQDEDGCPDPDNDGDGIYDGRDQCPDEAEDIDGWQDQDGCPDLDNDQDGVLDDLDQCPRTPADSKVDENGCAIEVPTVTEASVFVPAATEAVVLKGVSFLSGSAELTAESIMVLMDLAQELNKDTAVTYEIRGHTDSTGGANANRNLSQRRAASVRASLVQMGVGSHRLLAIGYGEDAPLADNTTAEGRALNRRVEIHRN